MKLVDPAKTWFVVASYPRCEGRAAHDIQMAGFDVYYPRMRIEKKDRRTNVYKVKERALLTGYLFVGFTSFAKHFEKVRDCDGVYDFVHVAGEPIPVSAKGLIELQTAEMNLAFDDTREARIHRGEEERSRKLTIRKRFPAGSKAIVADEKNPFASFEAVVQHVTKSGNVKALVNLFGGAVTVEFDAGQLTPAA